MKWQQLLLFFQGQFVDSYDPTIENTFNKNMKIQGQEYEVLVVDTAGQDEYSIFPTQYTLDIDGYVLVYSIDNEKSFEVVQAIYEKLVDLLGNPSFPLVIVGNKSDLHMNRVITQATGKKLAQDLKAMFFETSAKDNHCATDLFTKTIIQIEKVNVFVYMIYFSFKHNNLQIEGNSLDDQKKGCLISWKVQWGRGSKWLQVATENIELCQPSAIP